MIWIMEKFNIRKRKNIQAEKTASADRSKSGKLEEARQGGQGAESRDMRGEQPGVRPRSRLSQCCQHLLDTTKTLAFTEGEQGHKASALHFEQSK